MRGTAITSSLQRGQGSTRLLLATRGRAVPMAPGLGVVCGAEGRSLASTGQSRQAVASLAGGGSTEAQLTLNLARVPETSLFL